MYLTFPVFNYTCMLLYMYLTRSVFDCFVFCWYMYLTTPVFDYACAWLYMFLTIHLFDYTSVWSYMYVFGYIRMWLYMYLTTAEPPLYISIPGLRCSLDSVIELPYLRRTGTDGCHVSMDHTCIWLYVYVLCMHLIGHVFDHACIWLWLFLITHVFYYTCISRYMYLTTIVSDYTCIFLYMYLTVHVISTRGRNNPHSKSGRARDDYLQPFSHSIPLVIGWDQVSPGREINA